MTVEGWVGFQTGLLLTVIFALVIIVYFKLRERVAKVEKLLRAFKEQRTDEPVEEETGKDEPKEI